MQIELTEQQARSVAQAARLGLNGDDLDMNPGDMSAAFKAADILDRAWREATNTEEPASLGDSTDG